MIVIDCKSPLNQRILEYSLKEFLTFKPDDFNIIITDNLNLDLNEENIIIVESTLELDEIKEKIKKLDKDLNNKILNSNSINQMNKLEINLLKALSKYNFELENEMRKLFEEQ